MRYIDLATLFAAIVVSACALPPDSDSPFEVIPSRKLLDEKSDEIRASATIEGSSIQATIKFRKYGPNDNSDQRHWYGTDGGLPDYVIQSIIVTKDGKPIPIDPSNYSNFGDISINEERLSIIVSAQNFGIRYSGSDGAGSYEADFIFVKDRLDRVIMNPYGG